MKVLIVGCGHMGSSHAKAYHNNPDTNIVGLVSRSSKSRNDVNKLLNSNYDLFSSFDDALETSQADIVFISTYTESHVEYAIKSFEAGAHVFVEKPIATTVSDAEKVIETAILYGRKLIVGYILRVHPSWTKFITLGKSLGKPLVMRLNLNQQSSGDKWRIHKNLMKSTSPIVDCGVHYIDVMCQICEAKPISVYATGARLTDEISDEMYNYGQLQVRFDDSSIGWYESGWGPMMSTTAYFVKDIIGPRGSVSMLERSGDNSDNIDSHVETQQIKLHRWSNSGDTQQLKDEWIQTDDEPDHDALCRLEQESLLHAIKANTDLTSHWNAAIDSLRVVLAADESVKTGEVIKL